MKKKRVLLKISWEALNWEADFIFDDKKVKRISEIIIDLSKTFELIIVTWAGNIWRQRDNVKLSVNRVKSDTIWMMATLINSSLISQTIINMWVSSVVYSADAVQVWELARLFNVDEIDKDLSEGKIVFAAWWTWLPFFTTDTAAALRAAQCNCDLILKATKVDWVYDKDPVKHTNAKKFNKISFDQSIDLNLKVMDQTAFSICKENDINILVFKLDDQVDILSIISWDQSNCTLITNN